MIIKYKIIKLREHKYGSRAGCDGLNLKPVFFEIRPFVRLSTICINIKRWKDRQTDK